MRSQLRFVMHPDDEQVFVAEVLREKSVVLIDGPRWPTQSPEPHHSLESVGWYCILWSTTDAPKLHAEFIPSCGDWYCRSEGATIQFLRSQLLGSVLTEGRLAVATDEEDPDIARCVERRYRDLSRFIKKTYRNRTLRWFNPTAPAHPKTPGRSANPSDPDLSLWVGPFALQWLADDPGRCVKQDKGAVVFAELDRGEHPTGGCASVSG